MGSGFVGQCSACGHEFKVFSGRGMMGKAQKYVRCPKVKGLAKVQLPNMRTREDQEPGFVPVERTVEGGGAEVSEYHCPQCGGWHQAWNEVDCPECGAVGSVERTGLIHWD